MALKKSARNWTVASSFGQCTAVFLASEMSISVWSGYRRMPLGVFPKPVAIPSSPTTAGAAKQAVLM